MRKTLQQRSSVKTKWSLQPLQRATTPKRHPAAVPSAEGGSAPHREGSGPPWSPVARALPSAHPPTQGRPGSKSSLCSSPRAGLQVGAQPGHRGLGSFPCPTPLSSSPHCYPLAEAGVPPMDAVSLYPPLPSAVVSPHTPHTTPSVPHSRGGCTPLPQTRSSGVSPVSPSTTPQYSLPQPTVPFR